MTSRTGPTGSRNTGRVPDYAALLGAAGEVQKSAAGVTQARREDIARSKPMHAYGIDWLIAVAIKSWLVKGVGVGVPIIDILGSDRLASLSVKVAANSQFEQKG